MRYVHVFNENLIKEDSTAGNYDNNGATGVDALAAGVNASATGDYAIAIGRNAVAKRNGSIATAGYAIAIGSGAAANYEKNVVIGAKSTTTGIRASFSKAYFATAPA